MDASMLAALHVCPVCYYRFTNLPPAPGADDAVVLGAFVREVARHLDGHPLGEWLPALLAAQQVPTQLCPVCQGRGATERGDTCGACMGRGRVPMPDDAEQTRPISWIPKS